METLIKFRSLADQLTDNEIKSLVLTLMQLFGSNFILGSIFDHFSKSVLNLQQYDVEQMTHIITIISGIIESREKHNINHQPHSPSSECNAKFKIDLLPPPIIGKTASFLQEIDFNSFQLVNRNIYVGCNDPCSLQLFCRYIYSGINSVFVNWKKFKHIKELETYLGYFNKCINKNNINFTNLQKVIFSAALEEEVAMFSDQQCIDLTNVTHLMCVYFGDADGPFLNAQMFLEFLSGFTNLECLDLREIYLNGPGFESDQILSLFPKLKAIQILENVNRDFSDKLLDVFGPQIEALDIVGNIDVEFTTLELPKLEELTIREADAYAFECFLSATKILKKVCIQCPDVLQIKDMMVDLVYTQNSHQKSIEFLCICSDYSSLKYVMDAMKFFADEKINNTPLKIRLGFEVNMDDEIDWKQVMLYATKISIELNKFGMNDFMLQCGFFVDEDEEPKPVINDEGMITELNDFDKDKYLVNYFIESAHEISFVISNKNCKFNGYHDISIYVDTD